jgi:ATP-dependent DNA helicase RecG
LLRFADLEKDLDLVELARDTAERLLRSGSASVAKHLDRWIGQRRFYLKA